MFQKILIFLVTFSLGTSFNPKRFPNHPTTNTRLDRNSEPNKKYPIGRPIQSYSPNQNMRKMIADQRVKKYPLSQRYFEQQLARLNSNNATLRDEAMLGENNSDDNLNNGFPDFGNVITNDSSSELRNPPPGGIRIIINGNGFNGGDDDEEGSFGMWGRRGGKGGNKKSENFEVVTDYPISFNGKRRFNRKFNLDLNEKEIEKQILSDKKADKYLNDKSVKKVIIIKNKIINIVF